MTTSKARSRGWKPFFMDLPLATRAGALVLISLLLTSGCGKYRPVPQVWDQEAYRRVSVAELKAPRPAGLGAGDLIQAPAYFWEFIRYDPAIVRNYLTRVRHPIAWPRLKWFAVYETPQMHGYFERLAMDEDQQRSYKLSRLDRVRMYGELAPMGGGLLYLRVHRLEKLEEP